MFAVLPALALAALVTALTIGIQTATRGSRTEPVAAPSSDAALAARRHAGRVHLLAWAALALTGAVTLWLVTRTVTGPAQGRLIGLVPATAGIAALAVHAVGDLTWPRPTGAVRRATLARRSIVAVTPRHAHLLTVAWALALVAVLVTCGVASDDGRSITRTYVDGSTGAGPFPGRFYGVPLLVATLVLLATLHAVLALMARRPAVAGVPDGWDLELRRHSARAALGGTQLVLGLTLAAVLLLAGTATLNVGTPTGSTLDGVPVDPGSPTHVWLGAGLMVAAAVVTLTCLVVAMRSPQAVRTPAVVPA